MAKVLITGIRGFTGQHLLKELLDAGHEVCGLAHTPAPEASVRVHVCDLLDRTALTEVLAREQPEAVVHLAAIAFVAHGDARAIYETNVVGTRNLLDAIHTSGCRPKSVLLASSANIYGNADREVIDESTPAAPANDYAVSKLAMEYMARLWEDKLPITIVRPFNYTGVGQSPNFLLPKIVSHFRERKPVLELGNLHVVRDFSDVRSVVSAYGRLLDEQFAGQTFNVCSGTGYALEDVLAMMCDLAGYQPEIKVNMAFVRANEVHTLIGSNAKLREAIGAQPTIALRDTLQWMLEAEE
ncbi:NAD-dependent epimerase/dehydratase family protein [Ralstonia thomasii]|jgi:nucleoside-diphosphate-sugar epimerase|uniref:GDP-6-deoxy-D-talose 4-dehydrogenase n=2 Tax=Ralstonia TaxID=48736 RepID=A0AAD2BSP2_9RALS|nr:MULTISPECIES: GDP-mannose 4,6-dehydratase [Ralstonia]MBT2178699.1 GDP-mannose 4,6-dehydratase [Ralstonia pickettii]OCS48917.1 GDP-mannose 4,6 dehydratase [Ralstonia pickettii]CAJ0710028.1 GDP-6-deoxy-D-talose 4-dehydrogenase [Ralstonia sp. LMG 18095]CAJ0785786.1 GDP-6-deoxy-D-talose 4-dehydrogenase [Ralstonia sp. LMG 18095]CAJ0808075.1 GDP-6-deoxy-D-talose 4-dehydrogenase [Ralstonia sp. LMG 18095]